jgi:hypothetical protein
VLICTCTILIAASSDCTNPDEARINRVRKLAPQLSEEAAYRIVMSDDSLLTCYVSSLGRREAVKYWVYLREGLDYSSLESYKASASVLRPLMKKIDTAITSVFYPDESQRY